MRNLCLDKDLAVLKKAVYKVENGIKSKVLRDIVLEYPLNLYINGNIINTFLCTQGNLKELVIGYAKSKGFIQSLDDIKSLEIDEKNNIARLYVCENSFNESDNNTYKYLNSKINLSYKEIHYMMEKNLIYSKTFKNTGKMHSVSIFDKGNEIITCDDIKRHNAMDKAIGFCVINNISLKDKAVALSGYSCLEMILKAKLNQIPIVISKLAPTNLSIELAEKSNITLVGFVRDDSMHIYTHPHRIEDIS